MSNLHLKVDVVSPVGTPSNILVKDISLREAGRRDAKNIDSETDTKQFHT